MGTGTNDEACGGTDCDDNDGNRYRGNPEVCDNRHDEDCDPKTFGRRDQDGDGHFDHRCCNFEGGRPHCGGDCDDFHPAVIPGAIQCNGAQPVVCSDGQGYAVHLPEYCLGDAVCVWQPNYTGVCAPRTAGYEAPPALTLLTKPGSKKKKRRPSTTATTPSAPPITPKKMDPPASSKQKIPLK